MFFEDESMIRDYQAIGRIWFLKGKQRLISTYGQHKGVKLVVRSVMRLETSSVSKRSDMTATPFCVFLSVVLTFTLWVTSSWCWTMPGFYRAKLLRLFLEANSHRLELIFLPPYSPEFNLMEGVWKWLKETVMPNVFFGSVQKKARLRGEEISPTHAAAPRRGHRSLMHQAIRN